MTEKTLCKILNVRKQTEQILAVEVEAKEDSLTLMLVEEKLGDNSRYLFAGNKIVVESEGPLDLFSNAKLSALYLSGSEKSFYSW